jgi:hypothetical protein
MQQWLTRYPILEGELARLFESPVVVTPVVPPPLPPLNARGMLRERERAIEEIEARGGLSGVIPLEVQLQATYELRDALGRAIERLEQEIDRLENTQDISPHQLMSGELGERPRTPPGVLVHPKVPNASNGSRHRRRCRSRASERCALHLRDRPCVACSPQQAPHTYRATA